MTKEEEGVVKLYHQGKGDERGYRNAMLASQDNSININKVLNLMISFITQEVVIKLKEVLLVMEMSSKKTNKKNHLKMKYLRRKRRGTH